MKKKGEYDNNGEGINTFELDRVKKGVERVELERVELERVKKENREKRKKEGK